MRITQDEIEHSPEEAEAKLKDLLGVEEINDGPNAAETLETLGGEGGEVLLTGRMSNNTLVHFPGQPSLVGQLIDVKLLVCQGFYYLGRRQ